MKVPNKPYLQQPWTHDSGNYMNQVLPLKREYVNEIQSNHTWAMAVRDNDQVMAFY